MKVAHLIGGVVTTVILSVVYIVMFAPIGLFFRLIGKDHLERKIDPAAGTYWHQRIRGSEKNKYYQQY